ncbi:MAG: alkaline phosphatase D family protein [Pirellulales bacterium]
MPQRYTRREFVRSSATVTTGLAVASQLTAHGEDAPGSAFASRWASTPDRVWLGPEYWANPLQDWRIAAGRLECIKAAPDRNVHLLTRALGEQPGDLRMAVRLGRLDEGALDGGAGTAGFRLGVRGPLADYRNCLLFGSGLDAGITAKGQLFIGEVSDASGPSVSGNEVELRVAAEPRGSGYAMVLTAHDAVTGAVLAEAVRENLPPERFIGSLALVANFGPAQRPRGKQGNAGGGAGRFWFADWRLAGSKVARHDERAFGPILFSQYTLSGGTLKMTAQMPPLGRDDEQSVRLEVERDGAWVELGREPIHAEARTATFRVLAWNDDQDVSYRLAYSLRSSNGATTEHHWAGTVRRDPVDRDAITVADVSCNWHSAFPNTWCVDSIAQLDPDLLAFTGDQFYEGSGGYGVQRAPLKMAILDVLRKWYLHGWTWRELMRDRPSVSIPDDHDVYQGNVWGESGAARHGTQEMGGYDMPPEWVNVVHRTQTAHHPDPFDSTPVERGISVYYGPMTYGRISFAVLADRQFKSGPQGKVPPTGDRGDHVVDPNFDPKTADVPGLELLGQRQLEFLRQWATDWRGAEMKAVISQTIFTAMATTHGAERQRLRADYDANGWPQAARNAALQEIRRAFAFHLAGDQHLPAVVHYGIEEHRDAGVAFAGPAINCVYPRWFEPTNSGARRAPGAPENTGDFRDHFDHPLTVLAVANPAEKFRNTPLENALDRASGIGLVRFDKSRRRITIECWPLLADISQPGSQFAGWPIVIDAHANYGRRPAALLPTLAISGVENPVIRVTDETTGEMVYNLRMRGGSFQPWVFGLGEYTVAVMDLDSQRTVRLQHVVARENNDQKMDVAL